MSLKLINEHLQSHSYFKELSSKASSKGKFKLRKAIGSFTSFLLAPLKSEFNTILVLTDTDERAMFFRSDLNTILPDAKVIYFPSTHHKPYDKEQITDTGALVQRSEALNEIHHNDQKIVVTSVEAVFEKIATASTIDEVSILIRSGEEYGPDKIREKLVEQGYQPVRFVDEPGEYAMRGGIMDIYPFAGQYPVRLEFFGDEVESIREFDADSQRSVAFLNETRIIPDLTNLPESDKVNLLTYFKNSDLIVSDAPSILLQKADELFIKCLEAYEAQKDKDIPSPTEWFVSKEELTGSLESFEHHIITGTLGNGHSSDKAEVLDAGCKPQPDFHGNFKLLRENITENSAKGLISYICCDNTGQEQRFSELLGEASTEFRYRLIVESIHEGFIHEEMKAAVYTDHQIFNRYHRPKTRKRRYHGGISFKELKDLNTGDYVVHVDYGIGQFAGFKRIKVKENVQEVVVLRYKEDSTLYVNVSSLHKLQKYSGKEGTAPRITKLGSGEWARKKAQTRKKVKDIAKELIEIYAKRKAQTAYAFSDDNEWQIEMEANFEYEETPDQIEAIRSVKKDMINEHPMDRLVCGDVGFGKTEVAIRAAFKAVMDNKQVALLVPTTILAEQHSNTFKKRMEQFPVRVEPLSRFRTKKDQKKVLKDLKNGEVDVVIGTHRLLSKDVEFKDLGLIIVDEEQRFGVSAKEKLKSFRASVDVLTLTATPIPRTLQFSLMGARDMSIINTPPPNRQPVYTEIHSYDEELIRDAILQEISRGGQCFFIHNRVKNIEETAEMIRRLVPDIRVRFGHGQMTPSQLEKIIADFYQGKFDVLVSTNIVENGIDIANANTIIINNADHFGLAELHQLRGRVGRSNRKAFCYLITRPVETLSTEARKRLMALEEFSDLGSGFNIAMRDLDIRGAGDILGAEQSGFINDIGFDLYTKILNDAVRELKENEYSDLFDSVEVEADYPETLVEFDHSALLPSDYVSDNVERLNLYRKLARAESEKEIEDWKEELTDRFGRIPSDAENLIAASKVKFFASRSFIKKVTIRSNRMWLLCPKQSSDLGKIFYESGKFQVLMERIEFLKKKDFQLVQKKDSVTFVIKEVNTIPEAIEFLRSILAEKEAIES